MSYGTVRVALFGVLALSLLAPTDSNARSLPASASFTLVAPAPACTQARLGDLSASRGDDGGFVFAIDLTEPGMHLLECGAKFEVFLAPGDRLRMTLDDKNAIAFSGRGAAANRYLSQTASLSMATFATFWKMDRPEFVQAWASLHTRDRERLREAQSQGAAASLVEREDVRLRFLWAQGRVLYPFFHWRETDAVAIIADAELPAIIKGLPIEDARWWSLPEHQALVDAHLHALAREALRTNDELRRGDNRWLRAELEVLQTHVASPELRLREATRLITTHIDENGSKGIDPIAQRWREMSPDAAAIAKVDELIATDRAMREGHAIAVYREVDDAALEVHVLEPTAGDQSRLRPAMLWLHGGSGTEGSWWHSPGVTTALRKNGVVVVGVELRTGDRFDSGPLEQIADASAAYRWVSTRAADYRIDPSRIGVAGFSSGATLALILATRGLDALPGEAADARRRPAAVVALGACANPIGPRSDGWFRKQVARAGTPSDYSPTALVASGQPRLLAIHATQDEYCEYDEIARFVERYVAAGNEAELSSVQGASHFFGFFYKPGQTQMQEAISVAIRRWGWSAEAP